MVVWGSFLQPPRPHSGMNPLRALRTRQARRPCRYQPNRTTRLFQTTEPNRFGRTKQPNRTDPQMQRPRPRTRGRQPSRSTYPMFRKETTDSRTAFWKETMASTAARRERQQQQHAADASHGRQERLAQHLPSHRPTERVSKACSNATVTRRRFLRLGRMCIRWRKSRWPPWWNRRKLCSRARPSTGP